MRSAIIAGQPIEFWVAMDDETTGGLTTADSNPTLASAAKNNATFTPGGGEMVISNVTANQGYRVTFTPATLPVSADDYQFIFNYIVGGTTYKLSYSFIAVPASGGGGGGGGDATLAKQNEILGYLTGASVEVTSPNVADGLIEVTEGRTYDGTRHPKIFWTVAKDYTGCTITLDVWRNTESSDGTITKTAMKSVSGTVVTSTRVEIPSLTATFNEAIDYSGCPRPFELLRFAVTATSSGLDEEIDAGEWYVYQGPESP